MKQKIVKFLVTGFYVGNIPFMPGTFGSLLGYPLFYLLTFISAKFSNVLIIPSLSPQEQEIFAIFTFQIIFCVIIYFLGVYLVNIYISDNKEDDPKEVVIDEILGQAITLNLTFLCIIFAYNSESISSWNNNVMEFIFVFLIPFSSFRFFDILKPWPISSVEKYIKGGHGVMLDDVVAAFFASIISYAITFMIID